MNSFLRRKLGDQAPEEFYIFIIELLQGFCGLTDHGFLFHICPSLWVMAPGGAFCFTSLYLYYRTLVLLLLSNYKRVTEIPTPVCGLAWNDIAFRLVHTPFLWIRYMRITSFSLPFPMSNRFHPECSRPPPGVSL